jgi:hypothetical protein
MANYDVWLERAKGNLVLAGVKTPKGVFMKTFVSKRSKQ